MRLLAVGALACLLVGLAGCSASRDPAFAKDDDSSGTSGVNLVEASDISCSYDPQFFAAADNGADLTVTVSVDNVTYIHATSTNTNHPVYGVFARMAPYPGSRISVAVEDAEGAAPAVPCDVDPGPGKVALFVWDGHPRSVHLQGEGKGSASVDLEFGRPPTILTAVRNDDATAKSAHLAWTAGASVEGVQVVDGGQVLVTREGGDSSAEIDGLCDGETYFLQVVGHAARWKIGTGVSVTLPNVAPLPPRILSAASGPFGHDVTWENPSYHDQARFEVYAGRTGFVPTSSTLRGTTGPGVYWEERTTITLHQGDAQLIVRSFDQHGLWTDSLPFGVGDPAVEQSVRGAIDCTMPVSKG